MAFPRSPHRLPITKYLRGRLRGSGDPAPPGQRYPSVTWRADIEQFRRRDDGGYDLRWNEKITPKLGPEIQLTDISIELWSGDKVPGGRVTMQKASVTRAGQDYAEVLNTEHTTRNSSRSRWRLLLDRLRMLVQVR